MVLDSVARPRIAFNVLFAFGTFALTATATHADDLSLWGRFRATNPSSLPAIESMSAGIGHTAFVLADGSVHVWGDNYNYAVATPPSMTDAVEVGVGQFHAVARRKDGSVVVWGSTLSGQGNVPVGLLATAISVGGSHTLALRTTGTVAAWGLNDLGQSTVPSGVGAATQIAAGHRTASRAERMERWLGGVGIKVDKRRCLWHRTARSKSPRATVSVRR